MLENTGFESICHSQAINQIEVCNDEVIITAGQDKQIKIWNLNGDKPQVFQSYEMK